MAAAPRDAARLGGAEEGSSPISRRHAARNVTSRESRAISNYISHNSSLSMASSPLFLLSALSAVIKEGGTFFAPELSLGRCVNTGRRSTSSSVPRGHDLSTSATRLQIRPRRVRVASGRLFWRDGSGQADTHMSQGVSGRPLGTAKVPPGQATRDRACFSYGLQDIAQPLHAGPPLTVALVHHRNDVMPSQFSPI